MTIGTYTFYTKDKRFAIDIDEFIEIFFEFFVNFSRFLLKINKFTVHW